MACFRKKSNSKENMKSDEDDTQLERKMPVSNLKSESSRMEPSSNEVSSTPTLTIRCETLVDPTLGFHGALPSSCPGLAANFQANSPIWRGLTQTTILETASENFCNDSSMMPVTQTHRNSLENMACTADFDPQQLGTSSIGEFQMANVILISKQKDDIQKRIEAGEIMAVSGNEESSGFDSYYASQEQDSRVSDSNTIVHNILSDISSDICSSIITDGSITQIRESSTEYFTVDTGYDTSKLYTASSTESVSESETSRATSFPDLDEGLHEDSDAIHHEQDESSLLYQAFYEHSHVDPGLNDVPDRLVMSAAATQPPGCSFPQISDAQMMMKLKHRKSREELLSTQILLDKLQSEHSGILRNLDNDRMLAEQLKESLTSIAMSEKSLREQVKRLQIQVDNRLSEAPKEKVITEQTVYQMPSQSRSRKQEPVAMPNREATTQASATANNKDVSVLKETATQLRCEIDRLKQLLQKSEKQVLSEIDRMKDVNNHVVKLTQVRSLLQQQLEVAWGGMPESEEQLSMMEAELAEKESTLIKVTSQYHEVDTELHQKKQDLYYHKQHIAGLQNQIEKSESHHKEMVLNMHEKDTLIMDLETDLREAKHQILLLKMDYKQLKVKAEQAEEDNLKLTSINNLIENMLATEKCENSKNLEELNVLRRKMSSQLYSGNNGTAVQCNGTFQQDSISETVRSLREQVATLQNELEMQAQKNMELEASIKNEDRSGDKIIRTDEEQSRNSYNKMGVSGRNSGQQMDSSSFEKHIEVSGKSNDKQNELTELKEQLREKDNQVQDLEKKINELNAIVKEKEEMTNENKKCEEQIEDSKRRLESHLSEIVGLKDTISKIREELETKEDEFKALQIKADDDLCHEREQVMAMTLQVQELEVALQANQATIEVKQETVNILQGEMEMLKKILDNQKRHLGSKFRRESLEIQEKIELRLSSEVNQLSVELEKAREQINAKTQENLKFQQEVLSVESQLEDVKSQLSDAQKTLMMEEKLQIELNLRLAQQQDEIKSLQDAMIKKAEERSEAENKELLSEIKELTQQMQTNLEKQLASDTETREREMDMSEDFNKKLCRLEADLTSEKAIHKITRHSLEAQEEANNVLRQQLLKKKAVAPEKKMRDRNDEINAIISRSQVRAQAMLSPGLYLDGTLRHMNAPQDYSTNSSPDSTSDVSFRSTSPMYSTFLSKNNDTQNN